MEFAFHAYNTLAETGIAAALKRLLGEQSVPPVLLCVGSDLAIGDSLGPLTGTLLRRRNGAFRGYVYGTLRAPVTAKEVNCAEEFLKRTHPNSKIIAIDAAVGEESEIGLVKLVDAPLRPGSGANKRLNPIGDVSILGILARKTGFSYSQLHLTRLNTVYRMADAVSRGIGAYLTSQAWFGVQNAQTRVKRVQFGDC